MLSVSCDSILQAVLLQTVEDSAVGQSQFHISFYVAAPHDTGINGNTQLVHVLDQRILPGEDAAFPLVRCQSARLSSLS